MGDSAKLLPMFASILATESSEGVPGGDIVVAGWAWAAFLGLIAVLLLLDLFVFNKEAHEITLREAAVTSIFWVSLGLLFTLVVWWGIDGAAAGQYLTGYVIEKSLSVDNVFVWAMIFGYFAVPKHLQHRVLFWGIFGALVLRAIFIFAGVALLERFEWMLFVFGGFLVLTAIRVAKGHDEGHDPSHSPVVRIMRRIVPVTDGYREHHFIVREDGKRMATLLLMVLVLVEATDVIFAVDSIPAILAVSRSQFIVFTSNAFAILGLRALYFLLAGAKDKLVYLDQGLGVILFYVGCKMIASHWFHINTVISLGIIVVALSITVWLSLRHAKAEEARLAASGGGGTGPTDLDAPVADVIPPVDGEAPSDGPAAARTPAEDLDGA